MDKLETLSGKIQGLVWRITVWVIPAKSQWLFSLDMKNGRNEDIGSMDSIRGQHHWHRVRQDNLMRNWKTEPGDMKSLEQNWE